MARTRAVDFEAKQRGLLASAAAVFAELGMDKASMAQVAARGGVSKALLYHYYPSKDALIFDVIRTHLAALDAALAAADRPEDAPERRMRLLVRQVIESYRDADDQHKVQLTCAGGLSAEQAEEIRAIERRIVRRFSAVIRAINPGIETERPLLMPVTMSLFGIMNWVYMWFRPDGPISREEYADVVTTLVLDGIRGVR
jgi:AcrR family transcriptional regulator